MSAAAAPAHVGRLAEAAFERHGDYPAVLFDGRWYGSGELFERSCRIASGLTDLGLAPGDRVVVTMQNAPEVRVLYNAVWRAGGVLTPAMFLLTAPDLRHVVGDAGARFVVTSETLVDKVNEAVAGLDHVERIICVESDENGALPLAALETADAGELVDRRADDVAALLYTGGTTGRSKGVMLSHANLVFAGRVAAEYEAGLALRRELMSLPLAHAFGMQVTLAAMASDTPKQWILMRRFVGQTALQLIQEHAIDEMQVVPSMLQLLLAEPLERFDLTSLRAVMCGGSPLPAAVIDEFNRRVPSAAILEGYGMSETISILTTNPPGAQKTGSVGPALPGVDVRVVDGAGEPVQPGEVGEICCRGPCVMLGYWKAPELTNEALRDGWLHTGDMGYLDEDGYLFIVDRKKDVIIRGGFNVYPRDVEDAIAEHPSVRMASVVGRPDQVHGEEVVAFVTLHPGASETADDLVAWARERIGGYKYPREVHVIESLPLTDVGKIDRKALRALIG